MARAIGIDLATACSSVAVFQNDKVEIIHNEDGNRTTPSYVAFTDNARLIGETAKNQVNLNPTDVVFHVESLIGCNFNHSIVQSGIQYWPFEVINEDGKAKIRTHYKKEPRIFTPEEILSMILTKMKLIARNYLGRKINEAVITVPALFNSFQRQAIKNAGFIAGFTVVRILTDTAASTMIYGLQNRDSEEQTILVFDLGAGTLSVSIVNIEKSLYETKSVAGNLQLGGIDFDNCMIVNCVQEFKRRNNKDLTQNKRALCRLRMACIRAKHTLSSASQAIIEIDSLHDGIDFYFTITRACFENLCADLFQSILEPVEKALYDAKMSKSQIDEIVLAGGSTRIPKVQQLLRQFFDGKELNRSINSDEAVAYGAAIEAANSTDDKSESEKKTLLMDVTPTTFGIEEVGGRMIPIILHNTTIPTRHTVTFRTDADTRICLPLRFYEGKGTRVEDNHFLGEPELPGIPPAPPGVSQIEVTIGLDANGFPDICTTDTSTEHKVEAHSKVAKGSLTKEDLARMIADAEVFEKADEDENARILSKNELESYCHQVKAMVDDQEITLKLPINVKTKINELIEAAFEWIERDEHSTGKEEFEKKVEEMKQIDVLITATNDHGPSSSPPAISSFYIACRENDIEAAKECLQTISVDEINRMEPNGSTALHVASYRGHEKIVELLLQKGASLTIINKYQNTPLDEAKTDQIKQMMRRRMNKKRFVSDAIEWILATDNADFQAHEYLKKLETYGTHANFRQFVIYIVENYLKRNLESIDNIDVIHALFDEALRERDPTYLLRAYTAETGFYSTLNIHLANLQLDNLTSEENLSRAYYIAIIRQHPNLRSLSFFGTTYRGMMITKDDLKQYRKGTRILIKTFASTSKELDVALSFLRNDRDTDARLSTICRYQIRNPRTALDIEHISVFAYEREVLIMPYAAFKIIDIEVNMNSSPAVEIKLKECEPW